MIKYSCDNYWRTIIWTMNYYFNKCPSWSHYYYFRAAPCLTDMTKFVHEYDLNDIKFAPTEPNSPHQQLMMILPPNSSNLLPTNLSNLMKNELCHYYPINFMLEKVDKKVDWMYEPILPHIDENEIKKYVD